MNNQTCTTSHHNACPCREARFAEIEAELQHLQLSGFHFVEGEKKCNACPTPHLGTFISETEDYYICGECLLIQNREHQTELEAELTTFKAKIQCHRCGGLHDKDSFPILDEIMICHACRQAMSLEKENEQLKSVIMELDR